MEKRECPDTAGGNDQEGRRGSNDVVWGTWVFPWSEACMLGNFGGAIMGAKYCFALQWERGHLLRRCGGQGAHAAKTMDFTFSLFIPSCLPLHF